MLLALRSLWEAAGAASTIFESSPPPLDVAGYLRRRKMRRTNKQILSTLMADGLISPEEYIVLANNQSPLSRI